MRHFSVGRTPVGLLFGFMFFAATAFGATPSSGLSNAAEPVSPAASLRVAANRFNVEFSYAGAYLVDGEFVSASTGRDSRTQQDRFATEKNGHPAEVPVRFNLHSREQTVENYLPRYRAKKTARGQSFWTAFRDNVVTFAYGHERLLAAPQRVITDSTGRVVVVDPAGSAVHVLSPEQSFRIVTGPDRRVEQPAGIALDRNDNIYIADSARGVIAVYDPSGKFLRYVGKLGDESLFHYPTGIAIDRRTDRLYVLDTERHLLFVTDLFGHEIRRVGRYASNDKVTDFLYPTEVAVGEGELAILDSDGQRVWITDLDGNPLNSFLLGERPVNAMNDHVGLAIDVFGNIYVSQRDAGRISVHDREGRLLNTFAGRAATAPQIDPTGVCIDRDNRLFVSDQSNRRVEVFQISSPEAAQLAGDAPKHAAESSGF